MVKGKKKSAIGYLVVTGWQELVTIGWRLEIRGSSVQLLF